MVDYTNIMILSGIGLFAHAVLRPKPLFGADVKTQKWGGILIALAGFLIESKHLFGYTSADVIAKHSVAPPLPVKHSGLYESWDITGL